MAKLAVFEGLTLASSADRGSVSQCNNTSDMKPLEEYDKDSYRVHR